MKYYRIKQGKEIRHTPEVIWLDKCPFSYNISNEEFTLLDSTYVAYFDYQENMEFPDILEHPSFLISDMVKHVFQMYVDDITFKGLQLYPTVKEKRVSPYYWIPSIPEYVCLSNESEFHPNGTIKNMVLDSRNIPNMDVFKVSGIFENRIVVSLPVVESILRRSPYGAEFEEVRIK